MNKTKKIMFLINRFGYGGAEKTFTEEIKMLSSMGYEVSLAFLYGSELDSTNLHLLKTEQISFLKFKNLYDIRGYVRLVKLVREKNVSKIYSTLDDANFVSRLLKLFLPSLKIYIREANIAYKKSLKMRTADIFLNLLSYKIVAVSRAVKQSIFYSTKVIVLENGVYLPHKTVSYRKKDKVNILSVGSLEEKKDHLSLFQSLKDVDFGFRLNVAGNGSLKDQLGSFIRQNHLDDRISLLGNLEREKLNEVYLNSDIFVLSSKWEGFPNVLLEAMSYGLPVVSTKVSGAEDLIEDGKSGFLVPVGDVKKLEEAILKLATDYDLRKRMGEAARERVKNNLMDKHIGRLIKILEL